MKTKTCPEHGKRDLNRSHCDVCGTALKVEEVIMVYRFAGKPLSGINDLKGEYKGRAAAICCSGTTLRDLDLDVIPKDWILVAVNEAIRKLGDRADHWVLSDTPIVREYAKHCPKSVHILAMHQATTSIEAACPKNKVSTVNSRLESRDFGNGYEFFSRGTVLIGAVEMLRFAGVRKVYIFGCDCYRTEGPDGYYYDGRKPQLPSERQTWAQERVSSKLVPPTERLYVTARLKRMIVKLNEAKASGLWDGMEIYVVNSPYSQQKALPLLSLEEFAEHVKREAESRKRTERRKRAKKGLEKPTAGDAGAGEAPPGDGDGSGSADPDVDAGAGGEGQDSGGGDPDVRRDRDASGGDGESSDTGPGGPSPAFASPDD